jgi:NADPH:quinone reductase-like Zn-dependent oxidoreductase
MMRVLNPDGKLLANGGGHSGGKLARVIRSSIVSMFERRLLRPSTKSQNREDLAVLKELVEAGRITPVVGGTYTLDRTPEAIDHVAQGHARGTVVISVSQAFVGATASVDAMTPAETAA